MERPTIRVQYLQVGMITTLGTIASIKRHGAADIFRVTFEEGAPPRTCAWGAVFYLAPAQNPASREETPVTDTKVPAYVPESCSSCAAGRGERCARWCPERLGE